MILYELLETEKHQAYQDLSIDNLERQYDFLRSIIRTAVDLEQPMISTAIIKALNGQAISCLHVNAGEYRPCPVSVGQHTPPAYYRVPELMNAFINHVNYLWENADPIGLGAYVLWRLNYIHPFINGNGRTARALCYFVICVKLGGILKGTPSLPELIRSNRPEYVKLLQEIDRTYESTKAVELGSLQMFLTDLLKTQLQPSH